MQKITFEQFIIGNIKLIRVDKYDQAKINRVQNYSFSKPCIRIEPLGIKQLKRQLFDQYNDFFSKLKRKKMIEDHSYSNGLNKSILACSCDIENQKNNYKPNLVVEIDKNKYLVGTNNENSIIMKILNNLNLGGIILLKPTQFQLFKII